MIEELHILPAQSLSAVQSGLWHAKGSGAWFPPAICCALSQIAPILLHGDTTGGLMCLSGAQCNTTHRLCIFWPTLQQVSHMMWLPYTRPAFTGPIPILMAQ